MTDGGTTPPGWYPDPWYPASTRYWDGTTWTEHAQSAMAQVAGPALDLAAGRKWGDWAAKAFVVQGLAAAVSYFCFPLMFSSLFESIREQLDRGTFGESDSELEIGGGFVAGNLVLQGISLFTVGALVVLLVWSHRATTNARVLGQHTTHSPGWAIGAWLVPIVNFWYPYQVVRDLLPEGHPQRRQVGLWWITYLVGSFLALAPLALTWVSLVAGLLAAIVPAAASIAAGLMGRRLALAITDAQELAGAGIATA